jgi:PKD domain
MSTRAVAHVVIALFAAGVLAAWAVAGRADLPEGTTTSCPAETYTFSQQHPGPCSFLGVVSVWSHGATTVAASPDSGSPSTSVIASSRNGEGRVTLGCTGSFTGGAVEFGDGTSATLSPANPSVAHSYRTPGSYTARLTCTGPNGNSSTATATVTTAQTAASAGIDRFFLAPGAGGASCELRFGVPSIATSVDCVIGPHNALHVVLGPTGHLQVCRGLTCMSNPPLNTPVLHYGQSIHAGPFLCTSETKGMRCIVVRLGRGFLLSPAGLIRG